MVCNSFRLAGVVFVQVSKQTGSGGGINMNHYYISRGALPLQEILSRRFPGYTLSLYYLHRYCRLSCEQKEGATENKNGYPLNIHTHTHKHKASSGGQSNSEKECFPCACEGAETEAAVNLPHMNEWLGIAGECGE